MLHQRKFNRAHQVGQFMVSIQKKFNRKDKVKGGYKKKNICGLSRVWMREESNNTILLWFSITSDMYTVILRVGCGEEARKSSFNRDLWVVAPWWVMSILCLLAVDLFPRKLRFHPTLWHSSKLKSNFQCKFRFFFWFNSTLRSEFIRRPDSNIFPIFERFYPVLADKIS